MSRKSNDEIKQYIITKRKLLYQQREHLNHPYTPKKWVDEIEAEINLIDEIYLFVCGF